MQSLSFSAPSLHRHVLDHRRPPSRVSLSRLGQPARATAETKASEEEASSAPSNTCATCGVSLDSAPRGCDQKGRVAGGLGAVAEWWPIKAYRPCPALTNAGMNYTRKGQILDDMLFGRRKERKS